MGSPLLITPIDYTENDEKLLHDFLYEGALMLKWLAVKKYSDDRSKKEIGYRNPRSEVREMDGVRMEEDPNTSLLNEWNQLHHC